MGLGDVAQVRADVGQDVAQLDELLGGQPARGACPHPMSAADHFFPEGLDAAGGTDQFLAAVGFGGNPLDPAVAFHAVEHADEGGCFDRHAFGQFALGEFAGERNPGQCFPLPAGDSVGGQFIVHGTRDFLRGREDPKSDAVFEIVFQHPRSLGNDRRIERVTRSEAVRCDPGSVRTTPYLLIAVFLLDYSTARR